MKQFKLQMSDALAAQIESLQRDTQAASRAAVLRDALCLYTWVLAQLRVGKRVVAIGADNCHSEITTPGLVTARVAQD